MRGPPRHVMLPANRSPEAGLAGVIERGRGHREGRAHGEGAGRAAAPLARLRGVPAFGRKRRRDKEEVRPLPQPLSEVSELPGLFFVIESRTGCSVMPPAAPPKPSSWL